MGRVATTLFFETLCGEASRFSLSSSSFKNTIRRHHNMSLLRPLLCGLLVATTTAFSHVVIQPTTRFSSYQSSSSSALSVAVDTSEIKNGLTIEIDGDPYKVMSFSIMKQARGAAKTTIKMKNLKKGTTLENTYNSGAKFETAEIVRKTSQYTYEDEVREVYPFRKSI